MEQLEAFRKWLAGFPGWDVLPPMVDTLGAEPGSCGLFPLGQTRLWRKEDVLGNVTRRLRLMLILRTAAVPGMDTAGKLLQLQDWISENAAAAPQLGTEQTLYAHQGKLLKPGSTGVGIYELRLTVEYTKEEHYGKN